MGNPLNDVTTDQRGMPLDPDSPGSPDIGAFQTQPGLVVNTTIDGTDAPGDLSLRQAVNLADVPDESEAITFDTTAFATQQTITLDGSPLVLGNTSGSETIAGPASGLTISGGGLSGVFEVDRRVTAASRA